MKRSLWILVAAIPLLGFTIKEAYDLIYPDHFPEPVYDFSKNPLSGEKIELGRALFHDPLLSKNGAVSCASCHSPFNAFAHTDHALSHGINDSVGIRNAPALFNLAWQSSFMWDGAVNHLDVQALAPITDPKEMGEGMESVISKLQRTKLYPNLFYTAFGDSAITGEHLLKALSQFQLTLVTANSKYDRVNQQKEQFTKQELSGYRLFQDNCAACHSEPLFSNYKFASNGLSVDTTLNDYGRGAITKITADSLKFKTPTLRNLSYTHPYMHDGRFTKLRQVVDHYTSGIQSISGLSEELSSPIELTSEEKVDLISFLLTLNDKEFVFNPKFQFPKEMLLQNEGNQ
jgi:cytochrome c peroxidase